MIGGVGYSNGVAITSWPVFGMIVLFQWFNLTLQHLPDHYKNRTLAPNWMCECGGFVFLNQGMTEPRTSIVGNRNKQQGLPARNNYGVNKQEKYQECSKKMKSLFSDRLWSCG